jgi:hypothetical protein
VLLLACITAAVSGGDDYKHGDILESSESAKADARAELKAYASVLSFPGEHIRSRSCEGCTDDEVRNSHPAEPTESLVDNSKWGHRYLYKGELYAGQAKGKAAIGAACYYTHSVAWCNAQNARKAAMIKDHAEHLSREQKKEEALAMDGANDYDIDCFYHHEVSYCMKLHAEQKVARKNKEFLTNAMQRNVAYGSDPELAGLAKMVRQSEPQSQRMEDERVGLQRKEERKERDELETENTERERIVREERKAKEERDADSQRLRREEGLEARISARAPEVREERETESAPPRRDPAAADDSRKLEKIQREAANERIVAKRELEEELRAQRREAAAEAQLKAAKAQLHALAREKRHAAMPVLHALQAQPPAPQNAQPVETLPEDEVVVSSRPQAVRRQASEGSSDVDSPAIAWDKMHGVRAIDSYSKLSTSHDSDAEDANENSSPYDSSARMQRMERLHAGYQLQKATDTLSVRKQEPAGDKAVIAWDQAHGVRPIDSLQQERKARSEELAEMRGKARSQELADFSVSKGDIMSEERASDRPSELEKEALQDGLTLVPLQGGASSLVHRGLAADSQWEANHGIKAVSGRQHDAVIRHGAHLAHLAHLTSALHSLHSQDLLKRGEADSESWERRHKMISLESARSDARSERQSRPSAEHLLRQARHEGDMWERSHHMIPTSRNAEHTAEREDGRGSRDSWTLKRVEGGEGALESAAEQVQWRGVGGGASELVERAHAEAALVGPAGIQALGFNSLKSFEKHLEKEGI